MKDFLFWAWNNSSGPYLTVPWSPSTTYFWSGPATGDVLKWNGRKKVERFSEMFSIPLYGEESRLTTIPVMFLFLFLMWRRFIESLHTWYSLCLYLYSLRLFVYSWLAWPWVNPISQLLKILHLVVIHNVESKEFFVISGVHKIWRKNVLIIIFRLHFCSHWNSLILCIINTV